MHSPLFITYSQRKCRPPAIHIASIDDYSKLSLLLPLQNYILDWRCSMVVVLGSGPVQSVGSWCDVECECAQHRKCELLSRSNL